MTELERKAFLGDVLAREKCTNNINAIPCPKCGGKVYACIDGDKTIFKCSCGISFRAWGENPLLKWNTRIEPPIGRCGECKYQDGKTLGNPNVLCINMKPDDYCSYFEPKDRNKQ